MAERVDKPVETGSELDALLEHIRRARGFDFSGYKRPSLERRIRKRLDAVRLNTYSEYQDYLEANQAEYTQLFDTILINVTGFFRDKQAWDYVADEILPQLIADIPADKPIRVWSAACASGEEAYTIAMLLAEALGHDEFRRRVKVYATDVDDEALTHARQALYPPEAMKTVPQSLQDRYWEERGGGIVFRGDLRRAVIFGRNDLVQDAPISRVDLLISRNTLMYFTPETQARILGQFNFSLSEHGFLFLGKSEMLLSHSELFTPHSLKWRVFKKVPRVGIRDRLGFITGAIRNDEDEEPGRYAQLRDGAADNSPVPQVAVDSQGFLAFANHAARRLFGIGPSELGRPIQDLELSYRPAELRAGLARAYEQGAGVNLGRAPWSRDGEPERIFEVEIAPLHADGAHNLGASITFIEVTAHVRLTQDFDESKRQLETAYEELQSTVEELETTNEELQSTNEELETTNEELQSTNEELETMNEELQSSNDELETMNEVQRERSMEVERLNMFLEGILGHLGVGVVVVDGDGAVQLWNDSAYELWGLRGDEVDGQRFASLDIGLPTEPVQGAIDAALGDGGEASVVSVDAVNRRGRQFSCTVRALPLRTRTGNSYGAILIMSGLDGGPPELVS